MLLFIDSSSIFRLFSNSYIGEDDDTPERCPSKTFVVVNEEFTKRKTGSVHTETGVFS